MSIRRQCLLISRGVAILMPGALGWLIYQAAAFLVQYSSIEIRLYHAGFGFISNAAEVVYMLGPVASVAAGLVFGLLGTLVYLMQIGSFFKAVALNIFGAIVLLCGLGCDVLFPLPFAVALLLWTVAVVWVVVQRVKKAQPGASPNDGPATPLSNSAVIEGPPSVS